MHAYVRACICVCACVHMCVCVLPGMSNLRYGKKKKVMTMFHYALCIYCLSNTIERSLRGFGHGNASYVQFLKKATVLLNLKKKTTTANASNYRFPVFSESLFLRV